MALDISETIIAKSDQVNAEDLISGPQTYTVDRVSKGSVEQPVDVHLVEAPGRAYRPSKSMRRVLVAGWGKDASEWAGRRLTLYRDPEVRFGGQAVGGIKIAAMSHLDQPLTVALTVTRGKRAPHTVEPLPTATPVPSADAVAGCTDLDELRAMHRASKGNPERIAQILARVAELTDKEN